MILQQILTGSGTDTEIANPLIEIEDVRIRAVVSETDGLIAGVLPAATVVARDFISALLHLPSSADPR